MLPGYNTNPWCSNRDLDADSKIKGLRFYLVKLLEHMLSRGRVSLEHMEARPGVEPGCICFAGRGIAVLPASHLVWCGHWASLPELQLGRLR